ncbi:hypothetical protein APT_10016 (plasmid) [Acetobacter pasteurianus NBRC 101655]|nr:MULTISPECIES: hypothetical protein [Acetobacter]BAU39760.1 hypothetical protein APT_10016 [Acetobacter pasteurianus NBRC 101655]GBR53501.1 hypothetical protein AA11825_2482 [Acetobacter pomorum DSM 11825]CCT60968.1 hypothetical protein APA386B_1P195 [Acetobacter pasteurianus 386B]
MNDFISNMLLVVVPFLGGTLIFGLALGPILRRLNRLRDRLEAQTSHNP